VWKIRRNPVFFRLGFGGEPLFVPFPKLWRFSSDFGHIFVQLSQRSLILGRLTCGFDVRIIQGGPHPGEFVPVFSNADFHPAENRKAKKPERVR
jgi:hypothetical protein